MRISRRFSFLIALGVVLAVLGVGTMASAASETSVLSNGDDTYSPAAGIGYLAWAENSASTPKHYDTMVQVGANPPVIANEAATSGFGGGIFGSTLAYQQVSSSGRSSNIKLYDMNAMTHSDPPALVNSKVWDWRPDTFDSSYLFARNTIGFSKHPIQRIMFFNNLSLRVKTLVKVKGKSPYLVPGQLQGQFGVWTKCVNGNCGVFEYDSVGQTTTKIPTTGAPWGVSVTPDGTVYYFQNSPTHCGRNVKVVRYPPGGPGVVIGNLPSGSFGLNSYTVTNPDTSVDLFFDQFGCTTGNGDLYKIVGVDTAAPVLERVSSGGALDSPAGPAGPVEPPKPVGWSQGE